MFATDDTPAQQATPFEYFYVFRDRGRRHGEAAGKFSDGLFSPREPLDDAPARRVAERREDVVDLAIVNHKVKYNALTGALSTVARYFLVENCLQAAPRPIVDRAPLVPGSDIVGCQ
jgi:hypothetical protein